MNRLPSPIELADALNRIGGWKKASPSKSKGYMARCPNHNDRTPSLLITENSDGGLRLHCFGCADQRDVTAAVEAAMRWEPGTLWKRSRNDSNYTPRAKALPAPPKPKNTPIVPVPADAPRFDLENPIFASKEEGAPVAAWEYTDADGRLVGYIARYETVTDGEVSKTIWPWVFAKTKRGERWVVQAFPDPRPLYNLQKIVEEPDAIVQLHEGEKAADAGARLFPEWVSTTTPGGSNAVHLTDLAPLAGRTVVICPDNDGPGSQYAFKIAERLVGIAKDMRIMRLPTYRLNPGGNDLLKPFIPAEGADIADYLEDGWTAHEMREVIKLSGIPLTWTVETA